MAETNEKCAYCESKVRQVSFGDIEHIHPKALFPQMCYSWENLTFVCSVCNNSKREYYSDEQPLINPYMDEPREHLRFVGALILPRNGSIPGRTTIRILDLRRAALVERREERLTQVGDLVWEWETEKNPQLKAVLRRQLLAEAAPDKEYSAFVRAMLVQCGVMSEEPATEPREGTTAAYNG